MSRWIPSNLNVETRSIAPDEVKRGGKLIEVRGPRIISLVLYVLICISLLAIQVSREVRCDGMLLTEPYLVTTLYLNYKNNISLLQPVSSQYHNLVPECQTSFSLAAARDDEGDGDSGDYKTLRHAKL